MSDTHKTKGEGDRESARRYNDAARDTARSGEVEAREEERRKSDDKTYRDAEKRGRERARERDPEVTRDYDEPA